MTKIKFDPGFENAQHVSANEDGHLQVLSHSSVRQLTEGRASYDALKYALDLLLACLGLVFLSPLLLMTTITLLIVQGRPIFISRPRIGKNGVPFPCIKFRTMVTDGDAVLERHLQACPEALAEWAATRKLKNDPRVTPLGAVLRKSSIDELPQLVNIIRGEMSIVGPRPIVPNEIALYGVHFMDYKQVRPGLTGLWQVSGRSQTSYSQRVALDVRYVEERSLMYDFAIIAKTIPAVLMADGSY